MLTGIYRAAGAMRVAEHKQDVVANNLAHLNVPGFRKSTLVVQTFENALAQAQSNDDIGIIDPLEGVAIDFTPGTTVNTGRPLDVAVDGDTFFVLNGPDGPLYTRNGGFHIGPQGELVNSSGLSVAGDGGPITVPAATSPSQIEIASNGRVSVAGNPVGTLRLVRFDDPSQLTLEGTTVFSAPEGQAVDAANASVIQGYREQSNVSPVSEMIELISNVRSHEAAERILKALDETMQLSTNPRGG